MGSAGFWLVVSIFALGLSWLLLTLGGWVANTLDHVHAARDADHAEEMRDWAEGAS